MHTHKHFKVINEANMQCPPWVSRLPENILNSYLPKPMIPGPPRQCTFRVVHAKGNAPF